MVHVAASQLISSKLCSMSNPMIVNELTFPSPSTCRAMSWLAKSSTLRSDFVFHRWGWGQ